MEKWDKYFTEMVKVVASKSEDQSTKCGAIIVKPTNEVISTGYNGLPRGFKDTQERQERPLKYSFFEHAERNAIYNAARIGVETLGCKIYVTGIPCCDCARAIIQCGIKEVIYISGLHSKGFEERWAESIKNSLLMFEECGVSIREI